MIKAIINGILNFIINAISLLLAPIEITITTLLPGYTESIKVLTDFVDFIDKFVVWVISYFGLYPVVLTTIKITVSFVLILSFTVHGIKTAIAWYNALKK